MLKGIDPLISPDLLRVLAQMGHGDEIVIADANFPATSTARGTVHGQALRMECMVPRAVEAILSLLPIDTFDGPPVMTMAVVGEPDTTPAVVAEAAPLFAGAAITALERFAFYDRARKAFAIIATTDARAYGNFIIRKGVLPPG